MNTELLSGSISPLSPVVVIAALETVSKTDLQVGMLWGLLIKDLLCYATTCGAGHKHDAGVKETLKKHETGERQLGGV